MEVLNRDPFDVFCEKVLNKKQDFVTKEEVKSLWNEALNLIKGNGRFPSDNYLFTVFAGEKRTWISYPKFYRKRQILISAIRFLSKGEFSERLITSIEAYGIRNFYQAVDYTKISYSSKEDMIISIVQTGESIRSHLRETVLERKKNRRNTEYTYSAIVVLAYLLWEGFTTEDILNIKISDVTTFSVKYKDRTILLDKSVVRYFNEWMNAKERIDVTGHLTDISNRTFLFGTNSNTPPIKMSIHRLLVAYNDFSNREIGSVAVSRSAMFTEVATGKKPKQSLTEIEQVEYDCWYKTFYFK